MRSSTRNISITTDIIVGFPGETERDFEDTMSLIEQVEYDSMFSFKYSPRPNTAALGLAGALDENEKGRRLTILQERQRGIQLRRNSALIGNVEEVMVEGHNPATSQWIGRTNQNRTLNFTAPDGRTMEAGTYHDVRVTRAGPNSLAGELVA
jgi:tRNA-2-methylthio-N6-dimethylallyladenosine synthase